MHPRNAKRSSKPTNQPINRLWNANPLSTRYVESVPVHKTKQQQQQLGGLAWLCVWHCKWLLLLLALQIPLLCISLSLVHRATSNWLTDETFLPIRVWSLLLVCKLVDRRFNRAPQKERKKGEGNNSSENGRWRRWGDGKWQGVKKKKKTTWLPVPLLLQHDDQQ